MKHVPQRSCCVCHVKKPPAEFLRISSQNGAAPKLSGEQKSSGRGAYLCKDALCVERAFQRKSLERALKLSGPIEANLKEALRELVGK
jgi:predicted RNA-binding protein YlxR (DUF448 family)